MYFATLIFCDIVNKYIIKKTINRTNKDGNQDKLSKKTYSTIQNLPSNNKLETINNAITYKQSSGVALKDLESLEKYKFSTRAQTRSQHTPRGIVREDGKTAYSYKESDESISEDPEELPEYKYISNNEKTRSKQDKLNELVIRRSERNINRVATKKKYEEKVNIIYLLILCIYILK